MKPLFALTLGLLVAIGIRAQPVPTGSPPALKVVQSVDKTKGQIVFLEMVTRPVLVKVKKIVVVNGQNVAVEETQTRMELLTVAVAVEVAKSRVITPAGEQLPIDEVWKRLKPNTVLAVSTDGKAPAKAYLDALNADTLVLIPPQAVTPKAPPPQPERLPLPKKD